MDGVLWVALGVGIGGIIFLARLVARDPKDVPHGTPAWMGPDTTLLERALSELVFERAAGGLASRPGLEELARHHAFDMTTRNFVTDADPEGVDHAERRRRLHPELVGRTHQCIASFTPDAGHSPEAFAASLIDQLSEDLGETLTDETWTGLGLGVAVEAGRGAVCLVLGQAWAELSRRASWGPDSGWEVEGRVLAGTAREQLTVRLIRGSDRGSPCPADHEIGWDDDRFRLRIAAADPNQDTWVEILRDGVPGLPRRVL
jgi:hypothetical protein